MSVTSKGSWDAHSSSLLRQDSFPFIVAMLKPCNAQEAETGTRKRVLCLFMSVSLHKCPSAAHMWFYSGGERFQCRGLESRLL